MNDIEIRGVIETALCHFPLYLHHGTSEMVANSILREFKRNGIVFEQGEKPILPQRRAGDNAPKVTL